MFQRNEVAISVTAQRRKNPHMKLRRPLLLIVFCALLTSVAFPQTEPKAEKRDGQHDFDFEIGRWHTHLRRLLHPLSGSKTWVEMEGISTVRSIWDGRANLVELDVNGATGHFEALSLRLYNPQSGQWSIHYANRASGEMGVASVGAFRNGRGEFYDQEEFNGRMVLVRFIISDITAKSCHFEQSFSDDGGKTWEVNWIVTDTRLDEVAPAPKP